MYTLDKSIHLSTIIFDNMFVHIQDIDTQVSLIRAFPEHFDEAKRHWRRNAATNQIGPNSFDLDQFSDSSNYIYFMRGMSRFFKHFRMFEDGFGKYPTFFDFLHHLNDLGISELPAVEDCVLIGYPETMCDEDIYDLSGLLPNLKSLKLYVSISGEYLERFEHLEELYLYSEYIMVPLNNVTMQNLVLKMHNLRVLDIRSPNDTNVLLEHIDLPNLEVLKVNMPTLVGILQEVLELPRLRTLSVLYADPRSVDRPFENLFETILRQKSANISGISINNSTLQLAQFWDVHMKALEFPKLRKLIFESWPHSVPFLNGHNYNAANIEILGCSLWSVVKPAQLLHMIREFIGLKKLSINHCKLDKTFLSDIDHMLTKDAQLKAARRYTSMYRDGDSIERPRLFIYNYDNLKRNLTEAEQKYWRESKYIELEDKDYSDYRYMDNGFEFDFE